MRWAPQSRGSQRQLIVTSGTGLLPSGRLVTEEDTPVAGGLPRVASEEAARDVGATILRLPPSVHGDGTAGSSPS